MKTENIVMVVKHCHYNFFNILQLNHSAPKQWAGQFLGLPQICHPVRAS